MQPINTHKAPTHNPASPSARVLAYGLLGLLALLHFFMVLNFEINWDEFFRLARIYEWKSGTLTSIFESNYVHAFTWLEHVHKNEVYQVIAARCVMFGLLIYIAAISFMILDYLFDKTSAAITLTALLSFSFVFRHATSFRIDLPIIALLMTTIWLIIPQTRTRKHFIMAGLCLGLAGSISIKSVFYVPTIAFILLIHWGQSGWKAKHFINGVIVGVTSLVSFALLIYLHSLTLAKADSALGFISYASNAAILGYGVFPQKSTILASMSQNPIYWAILGLGFMFAIYDIFKRQNQTRALICLTCLLPLISLVVYVHTYVYFYTYVLAAMSLVVAYGVFTLTKHYPITAYLLPLALMINAAPVFIKSLHQTKDYQVQVHEVIHTMYPEAVNYIDRTSQIASFPKQGLFMTVVQVDEYRMRGEPVMESVFKNTPPEFILANIESLKIDSVHEQNPSRRLMTTDEDLLINNFIHHWGPIYVPGKTVSAKSFTQKLEINLPGTYTLESEAEVIINGVTYKPMSHVDLKKGSTSLSSETKQSVTLRWGKDLYRPDFAPLNNIIFNPF